MPAAVPYAVPTHVLPALTAHLERYVGAEPGALVLTGEKGGPLRPQVLATAWNVARAKVGRTDLPACTISGTPGSRGLPQRGVTVAELMRRAGHASPAVALRYQHATGTAIGARRRGSRR